MVSTAKPASNCAQEKRKENIRTTILQDYCVRTLKFKLGDMKLAIVFGLAVGLLGLTMGVRAADVVVGPLEPLERELTSIHCITYIL